MQASRLYHRPVILRQLPSPGSPPSRARVGFPYLIMNVQVLNQRIATGRNGLVVRHLDGVIEGAEIDAVHHRARHGRIWSHLVPAGGRRYQERRESYGVTVAHMCCDDGAASRRAAERVVEATAAVGRALVMVAMACCRLSGVLPLSCRLPLLAAALPPHTQHDVCGSRGSRRKP